MATIQVKEDLCSGCCSCVMVCSLSHEGYASTSSARLRIQLNLFEVNHVFLCRQCKNAPCSTACPEKAITQSSENSAWLINYEICTNCGACISACPFNAMFHDPIQNCVIKCDLCAGEIPSCVDACPTGALSIVEVASGRIQLEATQGEAK